MTIISTGKLPTYDEEVAVRNQTDAMTPGWLATAITLCGEAQDATVRTYGKNEVNLFKPARHRVERAKVHSREMIECWNEFLEPHPFAAHLTRTNATEYILTVEQYEEFPQELPALFGEWLYNLRSALDYIIWAAAAYSSGRLPLHTKIASSTQFAIAKIPGNAPPKSCQYSRSTNWNCCEPCSHSPLTLMLTI